VVGDPLLELLCQLRALDYEFTAVTPRTHARVLAREFSGRPTVRDIFGWNRPFAAEDLDPDMLSVLEAADAVDSIDGRMRSKVRVATLGSTLFLHSSFPTDQSNSVFFGPDTYRFARYIAQQLPQLTSPEWIIDMGTGSGAGGIVAAQLTGATRVTLVDVNRAALDFARINATFAGITVETIAADKMPKGAQLVVANPPYMMDEGKRAYRDGGALLGGAVALDWLEQALAAMAPFGTMLLYTGVAHEAGRAPLINALVQACARAGARLAVEEIDPDVFGDELHKPAYSNVERIAAVGAVIRKAGRQS
jgi:methylase of polypeptide subunit release factors